VVRVVFLAWVLYSLAINTVYQTFLTSFLVNPGFEKQISTEDEILSSGIKFGYHPVTELTNTELSGLRYRNRQKCSDMNFCISRMAHERDFAVLIVRLFADYMTSVEYVDTDGKPLFCHLDETFSTLFLAMYLQEGSPLLDRFNQIIMRVLSAGLIDMWWRDLVYVDRLAAAQDVTADAGDYSVMLLTHFQSAFIMLILGFVCSILVFLAELSCSSTVIPRFTSLMRSSETARKTKTRKTKINFPLLSHGDNGLREEVARTSENWLLN
jgi:hypothetical protein